MKIKSLVIIFLILPTVLCCWAQNIDDLLLRENEKVVEEVSTEAITMDVDRDVAPGTGKGIIDEEEEQDSLSQITDKWKAYLLGKNEEIQRISGDIQQKETGKIKKEEIDDFILLINTLQKDFNNRKETNGLWKANDELDELRNQFDFACEKELNKLNQWKETRVSKPPIPTKYIIIAAVLLIVMIGLPIFNQIKGSMMMRKAKKLQAMQAKLQQEEDERQRLLSDDANIVTLTRKL